MKIRVGGNKACNPVRSQPEVTYVDLRWMGETMAEMIGGVWFSTAALGTVCIDLMDWTIFGYNLGLFKSLNEVEIRLIHRLWKRSFF